MIHVYIEGIGLCGPGLEGWVASLPVLNGTAAHVPAPVRVPPSAVLPPNERRRAVQTVRLTLAVGAEAFAAAGRDAGTTAMIFTSSGGDGDTIHEILSVLASPNRELSPTRFHNSVHNTPAGYWGIAMESHAPSSALCCHDDSFAAGLLEAAVQAATEHRAVTLIAYDVQYPEPLSLVRPIGAHFAVALVLTPAPTPAALAAVSLTLRPQCGVVSVVASPTLEALRRTTPAARSLPLLAALARRTLTAVTLDYLGNLELALEVTPQVGVVVGVGRSEPVAG